VKSKAATFEVFGTGNSCFQNCYLIGSLYRLKVQFDLHFKVCVNSAP